MARTCTSDLKDKIDLSGLYDVDTAKSGELSRAVGKKIVSSSLGGLFEVSELVVEAASARAAREVLEKAVIEARSVMIMSVGGLINSGKMLKSARDKGINVYLPSGAICGIDGLKSARLSGIENITITTRKPLRALEGAPYLKEKSIDINSIKKETVIFTGNARQAVMGFPKNVNVSSLLSLAGIGAEKTRVRIVTSPAFTKNSHEIEINGSFGRITTKTENVPFEKNPKTSKLAAFSAAATLGGVVDSVKMGT